MVRWGGGGGAEGGGERGCAQGAQEDGGGACGIKREQGEGGKKIRDENLDKKPGLYSVLAFTNIL